MLNQERYAKGLDAKNFFLKFLNADCPKICVENPVPSRVYELPKYTQTIQPYEYGHPYSKRTCLWLKNLPPLQPTDIVEPVGAWCPSGSYSHKHDTKHKGLFTKDRAKNRSKTFSGIAKAMAEQWGGEAVKNFCICNAFKYLWRHGKKNGVEDVKKAVWYLNKFIELEEKKDED